MSAGAESSLRVGGAAEATAGHNVLAIRVPVRRETVTQARRLLVAFAAVHGADPRVQADLALAVSEAATNAVVHGLARDPDRCIDIVADFEGDALEIVIGDDGAGLGARVDSDGLGLGLGLIARSSARFTVRDREPGTEVWMRFELR